MFDAVKRLTIGASAFLLLQGGCPANSTDRPRYELIDLGDDGSVVAINNSGVILKSVPVNSVLRYPDGTEKRVGYLYSKVVALNEKNEFVGSGSESDPLKSKSYIWSSGISRELPGEVTDLNDQGAVLFYEERFSNEDTCGPAHSIISTVLSGGRRVVLERNLDGGIKSVDIRGWSLNNKGEVAGTALSKTCQLDEERHAFLFNGETLLDLGSSGKASEACCINDNSEVAGMSEDHAFLYTAGQMKDLGTLGGDRSRAMALNSAGDVVGTSSTSADSSSRAFLYHDGTLFDLNDLADAARRGWLLTEAVDINDVGQIIGTGVLNSSRRLFLLVPVK